MSRLETARRPNPTADTLWRYARAGGRQLVLTHTDLPAEQRSNGKAAKVKARKARYGALS